MLNNGTSAIILQIKATTNLYNYLLPIIMYHHPKKRSSYPIAVLLNAVFPPLYNNAKTIDFTLMITSCKTVTFIQPTTRFMAARRQSAW